MTIFIIIKNYQNFFFKYITEHAVHDDKFLHFFFFFNTTLYKLLFIDIYIIIYNIHIIT